MGALSYGIHLSLPPGWVALPDPASDVAAWAREVSEELWAVQAEPAGAGEVDKLATYLAGLVADCPSPPPVIRCVLLIAPTMPAVVLGWVRQLVPGNDSGPFTVEALAEEWGRPDKALTRPAEVSVVELPAGPSVRVRRTVKGPRQGLRRPVFEELLFLTLPPQLAREGVLLHTSWDDLVLGDIHAAEVDELAAGLSLDFDAADR